MQWIYVFIHSFVLQKFIEHIIQAQCYAPGIETCLQSNEDNKNETYMGFPETDTIVNADSNSELQRGLRGRRGQ